MRKYKLKKGILIAIEGIDGAGKTTQTFRLRDHFRQKGIQAQCFKEPTDGPYGQQIRNLAINGRHSVTYEEELELFIKDRICDCETNLQPALDVNTLVILDRYYFSNIAYQGALGLNINEILERNEQIAIIPDLVIILDLAVKIGLSRITNNRGDEHNHFENEEYLEKVRKIFKQMESPYIQIVNGSQDEDAVFSHIRNIVQDIIAPYITKIESQFDLFEAGIEKGKVSFSIN